MTYSVKTWDTELDAYTPQEGLSLPSEGLSIWELKRALKELKGMGYSCHRTRDDNDWAVLVERCDQQTDGTR